MSTVSTTPAHLTSAPYSVELIERYNRWTMSPRWCVSADVHNARFAEWVAEREGAIRASLTRYGYPVDQPFPEGVQRAFDGLRLAQVHYMHRCVRARELAPGAYIVGPSNYLKHARPAKAEKCLEVGHAEIDAAKTRLERSLNRMSPRRAISSDDPKAIELLEEKIADAERCQVLMREVNKVIRGKTSDEEKIVQMFSLGLEEEKAVGLLAGDFCGRRGFPDYATTNNNANIKRMRGRVADLTIKRSQSDSSAEFWGGTVLDNVADNRLQILFREKPTEEVRDRLKKRGFRWSPTNGAWQQFRSNRARYQAEDALMQDAVLSLQFVACALNSPEAGEGGKEADADGLPESTVELIVGA